MYSCILCKLLRIDTFSVINLNAYRLPRNMSRFTAGNSKGNPNTNFYKLSLTFGRNTVISSKVSDKSPNAVY